MIKLRVLCVMATIIFVMGQTHLKRSKRIAGGIEISIRIAPYNVQLRQNKKGVFCSGSLISPELVLTAAHCFRNVKPQSVIVMGGISTQFGYGEERSIQTLYVHPEYSAVTMHSDAAVLKLNQPMAGGRIATIPLCSRPIREGDWIDVFGWGRISNNGLMSNQLRAVSFPVASFEMCKHEYHKYVKKNMFCGSGVEPKGHCFGDSGGPAVIGGELCGINSFGYKCDEIGRMSAFTDVYAIRPFVEEVMKQNI